MEKNLISTIRKCGWNQKTLEVDTLYKKVTLDHISDVQLLKILISLSL